MICVLFGGLVFNIKVGDLIQTIEGWSYKTWTGIVLELDTNETTGEQWAKVCWTEASQIDGQVFWQPARKLEVASASR